MALGKQFTIGRCGVQYQSGIPLFVFRNFSLHVHIMAKPYTLNYFIIMIIGVQIATAAFQREDILRKILDDCMKLWQLDSVILISDKDYPLNAPQQYVPFRWLTAFQDLETKTD